METKKKPTIKTLTSDLLKFTQGSEILEKEFGKKEIDKLQKLKMTYKDLMGIIKKILRDDKFKDSLKYEAEVQL